MIIVHSDPVKIGDGTAHAPPQSIVLYNNYGRTSFIHSSCLFAYKDLCWKEADN